MASAARAPSPSFAEPKEYRTVDGPAALVSGDLNGDGKLDLVTGNYKTISVLLNGGDGSFRTRRDYPAYGFQLAIGDLNGDRKLDLVTPGPGRSKKPHLSVLLNRGDGRFPAKRDVRTGRQPDTPAVGDVNGDRKLDLAFTSMRVTGNRRVYTVSVLLNKGGGRFHARRDYRAADMPQALEFGDVNGDRKLDLVTANENDTVSVLLNKGGGRFRPKRDHRTGPSPTDVAVGDLNGDRKADLVTPNLNSIDTGPPRTSVLLNDGKGGFRARRDYRTGWIFSVVLGDLNADREPDLVVGSGRGFPSVLINRGNGSFEPMLEYRVQTKLKWNSAGGEHVSIGDLNGDGKADLATSNDEDDSVSVLINTPGHCNVQDARRLTLAAATRLLARANCSVGEVRRDYSEAFKRDLVMSQNPARGAVRPDGEKVDLVVSLGPRQ